MLAAPVLPLSEKSITVDSRGQDELPAVIVAGIVTARPADLALRRGEDSVSYAALWSRAQQFAGGLAVAGVRRGERVGIALPDGPDRLACELAATILGAIWSQVPRDHTQGGLRFRVAPEDRWDDLTPPRLTELDDHAPRPPCPAGLSPQAPACVIGGVTLTQAELAMQLRAEANDRDLLGRIADEDAPHPGLDPGWRAIIAGTSWSYPVQEPDPPRLSLSQRLWSLIG